MSLEKSEIKGIVVRFIVAIICILIGFHSQPVLNREGAAVVSTIASVIAILAGFLIAVMFFVPKPALKYSRDYIELESRRKNVYDMLWKFKVLFYLYLITLFLAIAVQITPEGYGKLLEAFQISFIAISLFVLVESFTLPKGLMDMHMDIFDKEMRKCKPNSDKHGRS